MIKDILIISHFVDFPFENGNDRFCYIANRLSQLGHQVEVLTSNYIHTKKSHRLEFEATKSSLNYEVTLLREPTYRENVSLNRVYAHIKFGKSVKNYLANREKPDIIYCAVPSLNVAAIAAEYCNTNKIRFIVDIQDLWPEAFKMIFDVPILSDIGFFPLKRRADFIYQSADALIAVSQTYLNRALKGNSKLNNGDVIFLGTDLRGFDIARIDNKYKYKNKNEIWIAYVGTLGHSYDITIVLDALAILKNKGVENLRLIIMGDGPLKYEFEKYARGKQVNVLFAGRLSYDEMVGLLCVCDIAVNPISKGAAQSIINKHSDYAAAGLPPMLG